MTLRVGCSGLHPAQTGPYARAVIRLHLSFALLLSLWMPVQASPRCAAAVLQARPAAAAAIAGAAEAEHLAWGGQTLDAHGRLVASGAAESEDVPRALVPWRRVLAYWDAVDAGVARLPSQVRFGALWPADRRLLHQALELAGAARLQGLGAGIAVGLTSSEQRALGAALDRAAVVDTPWSAAFVSWAARAAGLGPDQFAFSEAHADYAAAAVAAGRHEAQGQATPYALRACDLLQTPPRVGDLVCQARGRAAGLHSFAALEAALADRGTAALPMHCDVVVAVDSAGFDTVGGNVLQSVTRRSLAFATGTRLLDRSYLTGGCSPGPQCEDRHMSRQPWSLLLQWR